MRCIPAMLVSLCLVNAAKAQWLTVQLQGHYDDSTLANCPYPWRNWVFGNGETSYSFALQKVVEGKGDLTMVVSMPAVNQGLIGVFNSDSVDLGALLEPPSQLNIRNHGGIVKEMIVGHYYYLHSGNAHAVIQPIELKTSNHATTGKKGMLTYLACDASATLRLIYSVASIDELKDKMANSNGRQMAVADHAYIHTVQKGQSLSEIARNYNVSVDAVMRLNKLVSPTAIEVGVPLRIPKSGEAAPVLDQKVNTAKDGPDKRPVNETTGDMKQLGTDYDQFLNSAQSFLNLPAEQATVSKCDDVLKSAKALTAKIQNKIKELEAGIATNKTRIASLTEQISKITDLQLKTKAQGRIGNLTEESDRFKKDCAACVVMLNELLNTEKRLNQYKVIIGI